MEKKELKAELTFEDWIITYLQLMNGVNGLLITRGEFQLLKNLLIRYFEAKKSNLTDKEIFKALFSTTSRREMRLAIGCGEYSFNNLILSLKQKELILNIGQPKQKEYVLSPFIIPTTELTFKFELIG